MLQNNLKGAFYRYCNISKINQEEKIVKKHIIDNYKKEDTNNTIKTFDKKLLKCIENRKKDL